jgi:hypothetical protein
VPFSSIGRVEMADAADVASTEEQCVTGTDASAAALSWLRRSSTPGKPSPRVPRWKFFSDRRLSDAEIAPVFAWHNATAVLRHEWTSPGAYPRSRACALAPQARGFVLHTARAQGGASARGAVRGMALHPSAIEAATSAMEVMAVSARNAALLVKGALATG